MAPFGTANLSGFDVLMLDMNGTFMFGQDRFGPDQDYAETYSRLGGTALAPTHVHALISETVDRMASFYRDPGCHDNFPTVRDVIDVVAAPRLVSQEDRFRLEHVIAEHEKGYVPDDHIEALRTLAARHRLILVSNLWSYPAPWYDVLAASGVLSFFDSTVFSSANGCIKPGERIYRIALEAAGVTPEHAAFIGDDTISDIAAPRGLGMATVHIRGAGKGADEADWVVTDLSALIALPGSEA